MKSRPKEEEVMHLIEVKWFTSKRGTSSWLYEDEHVVRYSTGWRISLHHNYQIVDQHTLQPIHSLISITIARIIFKYIKWSSSHIQITLLYE